MNKLFSYMYEMNWRFMRTEDHIKGIFMVIFGLLVYSVVGFIMWKIIDNLALRPIWLLFSGIPCLILVLFLSTDVIQKKFKKYESEKVKFGKDLDEKYVELAKVCYSSARNFSKIKELADFIFPKILELHGQNEVDRKVFTCFRSVVQEDNLDTIRYFIFEQNVKISEEFRKNLKIHFPDIEPLFNSQDLKNELDDNLSKNKSEKTSKRMKV